MPSIGIDLVMQKSYGCASVSLLEVPFEEVRRVGRPKTVQWFGRFFVLLCVMTQSVGTIILSVRRLREFEMGETDIRNAWTALGGAIATTISIVIMLRNNHWKHTTSIQPGVPSISTTTRASQYKQFEDTGFIFKSIVTLTILNTWYLRYQICDTFERAMRSATPLAHYMLCHRTRSPARSDVWVSRNAYTVRYVKPNLTLPDFVWIAWPIMIYHALQEHGHIVLLITFFHSLGFPIEEMARHTFNKWKDPLADALYVF